MWIYLVLQHLVLQRKCFAFNHFRLFNLVAPRFKKGDSINYRCNKDENNVLRKVNEVSGGWKFLKSNFHDNFFLANYSGIVIYENPMDLQTYKYFSNLTKPIKNIVQNKPNELWAVDNYRSLYRILFDDDFVVKKIENVTQKNKILKDYGVKMVNFNNEVLFYINSKWYGFNAITDKLELNAYFNKSFTNISELIPIDNENFIILKDKSLYVINRVNNKFVWRLIPEKYYEGKIINQDTKVFKTNGQYLLNLDDGFFAFKLQKEKPKQLNPLLPGYAFDVFLVSGMTPIEQGSALDFIIDRPQGMKGFIVNLTIKGKGVSRLRASGRGDLKIAFQVITPSKLDSKQKELFRNLAKLRKNDTIKLVKHQQGFTRLC